MATPDPGPAQGQAPAGLENLTAKMASLRSRLDRAGSHGLAGGATSSGNLSGFLRGSSSSSFIYDAPSSRMHPSSGSVSSVTTASTVVSKREQHGAKRQLSPMISRRSQTPQPRDGNAAKGLPQRKSKLAEMAAEPLLDSPRYANTSTNKTSADLFSSPPASPLSEAQAQKLGGDATPPVRSATPISERLHSPASQTHSTRSAASRATPDTTSSGASSKRSREMRSPAVRRTIHDLALAPTNETPNPRAKKNGRRSESSVASAERQAGTQQEAARRVEPTSPGDTEQEAEQQEEAQVEEESPIKHTYLYPSQSYSQQSSSSTSSRSRARKSNFDPDRSSANAAHSVSFSGLPSKEKASAGRKSKSAAAPAARGRKSAPAAPSLTRATSQESADMSASFSQRSNGTKSRGKAKTGQRQSSTSSSLSLPAGSLSLNLGHLAQTLPSQSQKAQPRKSGTPSRHLDVGSSSMRLQTPEVVRIDRRSRESTLPPPSQLVLEPEILDAARMPDSPGDDPLLLKSSRLDFYDETQQEQHVDAADAEEEEEEEMGEASFTRETLERRLRKRGNGRESSIQLALSQQTQSRFAVRHDFDDEPEDEQEQMEMSFDFRQGESCFHAAISAVTRRADSESSVTQSRPRQRGRGLPRRSTADGRPPLACAAFACQADGRACSCR